MLGKLVKYDFKSISKSVLLLNLFIAVLTILGMISFASKLWLIESDLIMMLGTTSLLLYCFSIFGVEVAIIVFIIVRFYKNFYTDEGYLMHTLPVTSTQLLVSKLITGVVAVIGTTLVIGLSLFGLLSTFITNYSDLSLFALMKEFFVEIAPQFKSEFGISFNGFMIFFAISLLLTAISSILQGFCAVSFGQLFTKHKVLGCFVSYFAISFVLQIISTFATLPAMTKMMYSVDSLLFTSISSLLWTSLIFAVIANIVYYIICHIMMKKTLNLD